ncbi:MAG TPA: NAD(P)/FAD-dependent oxidoreductase [Acidimicrobiales bacterium]|nr:NAD(P)/FAD-dependent oxidoreductase [Acidimicrobiales bacterium]
MPSGRSVTTVIIGGGHSGLAMSGRLSDRGIDHVVLERGDVASSWVDQRWESFTLLTPNWQTRLPGAGYEGDDPDGYMTGGAVAAFLQRYSAIVDAPLHAQTTVLAVRSSSDGYDVVTDQGTWHCRSVVLASGACNLPSVPAFADAVPDDVVAVNPLDYRRPDDLPEGGVLVVGAAATGIQLADEIHASGRPVTVSVGEHVRMPRTYRGRDIQHWMEAIGRLDERWDEVPELLKARGVASPQLIGTPQRRTLDLNALTDAGVRLCGRIGAIRDGVSLFSGGLRNTCALADQKLARLLEEIDEWVQTHDDADALDAPVRSEPTRVPPNTPLTIDLRSGEIKTVVWATGFRPDFSWVELPVFDGAGRLRHDGGVVDAPGVYFLGGTFLRRRRSSFIHGAEADTAELADHLTRHLAEAG